MARISTYIIGIMVVGFIVTTFMLFMSSMQAQDPQLVYNASEYTAFSGKLNETRILTEELKNKTMELQQSTGLADILGGFFSAGYSVLKTSLKSVDTGISLSTESIRRANLGDTGSSLQSLIIGSLLVVIFIGIIISALVKVEL